MTEKPIWERMKGESLLWHRRFTAYRLMTPVRKIPLVFQQEQPTEENGGKQRTEPPGVWWEIARKWKWDERCAAWDQHEAQAVEQAVAAEKKKILTTRYALMHKRVEALDAITEQLREYLKDEQNIWLPDVKAIGNGPTAQRVDLVRFNDALFLVIDKYLGSIAAEMGERIKISKQELTGKDGKPLLPNRNELLEALSDEEFEQLKWLQAQALARLEQEQHGSTTD